MVERFVTDAGTISVANGASTVVGTGTLFGGRDREGAQIWVQPAASAPYRVGTVAAVDPRGIYDNLELPLVHPWNGTAVVGEEYELVDGAAIANGASQAAIYARFTADMENKYGLVGNLADMPSDFLDEEWTRVFENTIFNDRVTRALYQYRQGVLEPVDLPKDFLPRGAWSSLTTYAVNDLVSVGGVIFVSNAAGNLDNAPITSPNLDSNEYWTWVAVGFGAKFFELYISAQGTLLAGEKIVSAFIIGPVTFPASLDQSGGVAGTPATAAKVISFRKDGVEFGTATFGIGDDEPVFAAGSDTTFNRHLFTAVAPSPADATLADLALTLRATTGSGGGPISQQGIATLDFGAFPGAGDAAVVVTGQSRIEAGSLPQVWLWPGEGTDDHSADEHVVADMRVRVSDVVAGVGFTIRGFAGSGRHYGEWNVAWRW